MVLTLCLFAENAPKELQSRPGEFDFQPKFERRCNRKRQITEGGSGDGFFSIRWELLPAIKQGWVGGETTFFGGDVGKLDVEGGGEAFSRR